MGFFRFFKWSYMRTSFYVLFSVCTLFCFSLVSFAAGSTVNLYVVNRSYPLSQFFDSVYQPSRVNPSTGSITDRLSYTTKPMSFLVTYVGEVVCVEGNGSYYLDIDCGFSTSRPDIFAIQSVFIDIAGQHIPMSYNPTIEGATCVFRGDFDVSYVSILPYTIIVEYVTLPYTMRYSAPVGSVSFACDGFTATVSPFVENPVLVTDEQLSQTVQDAADDMMHGFKNPGMDTSSGQLEGAIGGYQEAEDDLFNSQKGSLDAFDPSSIFSFSVGTVSGITFCSSLVTSFFTASGDFSILVGVLFTVALLSIILGLFRFGSWKGGG